MLQNYFKIAWRNLWKSKAFSVINIIGLASGLACFILIAMYVVDELSYDRFNKKASRIFRIDADIRFGGNDLRMSTTSDMMGAALKKDYPEVENFARLYVSSGAKMIKKGNAWIKENAVANADSTFFDVFSFPGVAGQLSTALNEPNTVVLSEAAALKYFGSTDIIGKSIETDDNRSTLYKVTGVYKNMPRNSHFHYDFLFSMDNAIYNGWGEVNSHNFYTYLVLREGVDHKKFEKNFDQYIIKYSLPNLKEYINVSGLDEFKKAGNSMAYSLLPVTDIHLRSDRPNKLSPGGSIQYVYIFGAVSLFILLIACVNFMNLSTARSAGRAKEVGVRKVLGTRRQWLMGQFLTESLLMAFIATGIAVLLVFLVLPLFNNMAAKEMIFADLFTGNMLLLLLGLPVATGLLAGYYPAFFLSGFKPISVLKGNSATGAGKSRLRSGLVVFQFATSVFLIIGTMVVYRQLNFIQHQKLGYSKDQVLIIDDYYKLGANTNAFRNELLKTSGVRSGTITGYLPVRPGNRSDRTFSKDIGMSADKGISMETWKIDTAYIPTLGMEIKQGRNFSAAYGSDSSGVIINEAAAKLLGYENPVGQKLYQSPTEFYEIVGVVKDFNYESLRQTVGPLGFFLKKHISSAAFKISAADAKAILAKANQTWKTMAPEAPFAYRFLNESFSEMYRAEQRVGLISLCFSVMAILIACLGLFGLAAYMAEQRTKEIGIRKVLGASAGNLVSLLSTDFLKLVLIGFVIAAPLAWWVMNNWLADFAFRVSIGWWIFLAAGATALLIALLTISAQAIKAAMANPINSLRTE